MKLSQGAAKYEDFELPFTSMIQEDFIGGMLAENIEDDTTKYRDARHCDTTKGDVICGPNPTISTFSAASTFGDLTYDGFEYDLYDADDTIILASSYTPASTLTVYKIKLLVNYDRSLGYAVARIYSNNSGEPGTLLADGVIQTNYIGEAEVTLNMSVELIKDTQYWIAVYGQDVAEVSGMGGSFKAYQYYKRASTGDSILLYSSSAWTTLESNYILPFELVASVEAIKIHTFEHRRVLYAILSYDDGTTNPTLYMNGYRGVISSANTNMAKINTDADLSLDSGGVNALNLEGAIVLLIEGPGSDEEQPWRTIISNTTTGTNDTITVGDPWKTQPTTATSWVVLGTNDWWPITNHGITGKVTDVEIVYDYVAIALGDSINIRKFRWYNNSGTATNVFSDDGTNKADLLLMVADTEGDMKLWKAMIADNIVDYAPAQEYDTNHTFTGTDIVIGTSKYDDIKNLIAYGDPLIPYVIKENSFGSIQNDIYAEIPLGELDEVRSVYNGIAAMKYGVYLYFNLGEMIERFYDRRLDDVGPNRGLGMPFGRNGIIRKLLPYPGRYYALLYTEGNVPSILCHNGYGWHEIWRPTSVTSDGSGDTGEDAPFAYNVSSVAGGRCTNMVVQMIPGSNIDRLWFDNGGQLLWIPIAINPKLDREYEYRDLSQFETAWIYGNLKDVNKYWHSIKLHTENLSGTDRSIMVEYKVDTDNSWTKIDYATDNSWTKIGVVETSPIQELDLSTSYDVTGYRIKFRFTLHTSDSSETPRLLAYVVKGVVRVDVKKGWNVTVISENERDLNGIRDSQDNIISQLDTWANSDDTAAPLLLRHNISYYDNKYVFIDPASISLQQVELNTARNSYTRQYKEIVNFTMYEV
jgi:hypothetical protein